MFSFQDIQAFCSFNHRIIYQICDVMMSTIAWNKEHFCLWNNEPQLIFFEKVNKG